MLEFLPKRWQYIRGKATFPITDVRISNLRTSYPRKTESSESNDTFSLTGLHVLAIHPALSFCYGYQVSFLGINWSGRGEDHTSPRRTEVKKRVLLYFYSTSGPSRPVLG
jgi:hypothetical protein